jgi:hypothetical protein
MGMKNWGRGIFTEWKMVEFSLVEKEKCGLFPQNVAQVRSRPMPFIKSQIPPSPFADIFILRFVFPFRPFQGNCFGKEYLAMKWTAPALMAIFPSQFSPQKTD